MISDVELVCLVTGEEGITDNTSKTTCHFSFFHDTGRTDPLSSESESVASQFGRLLLLVIATTEQRGLNRVAPKQAASKGSIGDGTGTLTNP